MLLSLTLHAGTFIKQESSAAMPDASAPVQAVKRSTPLLDALNGVDGGSTHSASIRTTCSGLPMGQSSCVDSIRFECA